MRWRSVSCLSRVALKAGACRPPVVFTDLDRKV
jgi:hypothetical protein